MPFRARYTSPIDQSTAPMIGAEAELEATVQAILGNMAD